MAQRMAGDALSLPAAVHRAFRLQPSGLVEIILQRQYRFLSLTVKWIADSHVKLILQLGRWSEFFHRPYILNRYGCFAASVFSTADFFVLMYQCFLTHEPDLFNVP